MRLAYLNAMETELLTALRSEGVLFAVVGSHAVLAYSSPERPDGSTRTLGDLDILVDSTIENLERISRALGRLRMEMSAQRLQAIFTNRQLPNLGGGYGAQLFPSIAGVETSEVLNSAQDATSPVGALPLISKALLMIAKRAAGRPKDLEDLRALGAIEETPNAA